MKRIAICYDGTWNAVLNPEEVTNVVRVAQAIKPVASDRVVQVVYYNAGVGSGGPIDQFLGGVFGKGLRSNVKRGLAFLTLNWEPGDEIYIFGFSRGAYTARALAGVIGTIGGIPEEHSFDKLEEIWTHYRMTPEQRKQDKRDIDSFICKIPEPQPMIKCIGVWDTVGSYGIPSGLGLGALARHLTSWTRGFNNNVIGKRVEVGVHAMAIDEKRRAFTPTAWVTDGEDRQGAEKVPHVEQVWFAGAHSNVGGGYKQAGLSDLALIWMMARVEELTGLEFNHEYIGQNFWPCEACSLYRSYRGWILSSILPDPRRPSVAHAVSAGVRALGGGAREERKGHIVNEKVHWSVRDRRGRLALVDQTRYKKYRPRNLPKGVDFAEKTPRERELIDLCRKHNHETKDNKEDKCALYSNLPDTAKGWRARRMRKLRQAWADMR